MASLGTAILDIKQLDLFANGASYVHRLDARAKVLATAIYIVCVVSYGRYELAALFPFALFPAVMISQSGLPAGFIIRKVLLFCPFILAVAIFNPVYDREILLQLGPVGISGGWISCASILVRSAFTVAAAFIVVGVTGFTAICQALEQLRVPQVFALQLLFLYRYIFVLTEEADRTARAKALRSCGRRGAGIRSFGAMIAHLLLRTWQRAERIHMAMLARGFNGTFHAGRRTRFGAAELRFVLFWSTLLIALRLTDVSQFLGSQITRLFP